MLTIVGKLKISDLTTQMFTASLDQLHAMLAFVHQFGEKTGLATDTVMQIELAVEEALVNIIKYGFVQDDKIALSCTNHHEIGLVILIQDRGVNFNPLTSAKAYDPPMEPDLNECSIGGLGIYLILHIMDEIEFRREGDINNLIMIKYKNKKV